METLSSMSVAYYIKPTIGSNSTMLRLTGVVQSIVGSVNMLGVAFVSMSRTAESSDKTLIGVKKSTFSNYESNGNANAECTIREYGPIKSVATATSSRKRSTISEISSSYSMGSQTFININRSGISLICSHNLYILGLGSTFTSMCCTIKGLSNDRLNVIKALLCS